MTNQTKERAVTDKTNEKKTAEIGDFERPKEPKPGAGAGARAIADFVAGKEISSLGVPEPAPATQATQAAPATPPQSREAVLEKAVNELEQAPEMTYDEKLKAHGITKEQVVEILDAMFTRGFFEKTYKMSGNIFVTFRTRKSEDQDRLLQRLEAESPQFPATVSNLVSKYNLAASLWRYKEQEFGAMEFKARYDYVSSLPDIVFRLLCVKLSKFDQMMLDVMDEGAIANF